MDHVSKSSRVRPPGLPRSSEALPRAVPLGVALWLGAAWAGAADQPAPNPDHQAPAARAQVAAGGAANHEARRLADAGHAGTPESEAIARARQMIADCKARYVSIQDYTCTFFKRERIEGKISDPHVMIMKARTHPSSVYFKFVEPNQGREAIFVQGRNNGKIVAHEVGVGRVVAGTMHLDPRGSMAMEANRHPVTEAGIGNLIENIRHYWAMDLNPANTRVQFHAQAKVGDRACTMIETTHPRRGPQFLFHKVKVYVDRELNLPIRFEAYDWPARAGAEPLLMEEYTYANLKLNVGLKERDFDEKNSQYQYGRF